MTRKDKFWFIVWIAGLSVSIILQELLLLTLAGHIK